MKKSARTVLMLAAAFAARVWAVQPAVDLADAFGAIPQSSDLTLSASGRMLAWQQPGRSGREVVVYDLNARSVRRTVRLDAGLGVGSMLWEDDNTLLLDTLATERVSPLSNLNWGRAVQLGRWLAVDVANGRTRVLLADRTVFSTGTSMLAWDIPQRPGMVIMSAVVGDAAAYRSATGTMIHDARGDSGFASTLFSVDTHTGKDEQIASGDPFTDGWVVDAGGNLVARTEWQSRRYTIEAWEGGGLWRTIFQHTSRTEPYLQGLNAKARQLVVIMRNAGRWHLWAIPLNGSAPQRMLPNVTQQVIGTAFDGHVDKMTEVEVGYAKTRTIWMDPAAQMRYESVVHAFPGRLVSIVDTSKDGNEVLAQVQDSDHPPVYYLVNFATHHADIAGEAYPQLTHVALGTAHTVQYRTPSGDDVQARLVLPPAGGKDLPLVVLVPGGPVGSYSRVFDWFSQYLAASGYAVLRPEIGASILDTEGGPIYWGGLSQDYALAGVHLLVQQGVADARKVCIMGVGYGGYAALAGAAFSPHSYACAVSINGISDLPSLLAHEEQVYGGADSNHAVLAAWRTHVGSPFDPKLKAASPVSAAGQVAAPVLLIHDQDDTVVPLDQSLEMRRALQKAGKRVMFLQLDGSDHWLNRAGTRTAVLKAIGGFLHTSLH